MTSHPSAVGREDVGVRRSAELVAAVARTLGETLNDHPRLLATTARSLADGIGEGCVVLLLSDDHRKLVPCAAHDPDAQAAATLSELVSRRIAWEAPSFAWDATRGDGPLVVSALDPAVLEGREPAEAVEAYRRLGTRALLAAPMRARGEVVGCLLIARHRAAGVEFEPREVELARELAAHAGLAIANATLLRRGQLVIGGDGAAPASVEAEPSAADNETARANRFLDAIIENIPHMVFVKDANELAFTRFNRAGEALLGVSRADLIGKTDYDFFPPEEAEFFQSKDRETLRGKVLVDIPEEPIQTKRGTRWLHTKKVPILDESGTPVYLLGISEDITDRKEADAALRKAKDASEAANRELESFSYSVAHDLRAPLRSIDGYSKALLEDYSDRLDDEGKRMLGRVRDAAQRMARLIDDLLLLSRTTRTEMQIGPIDLGELARTCISHLERAEPHRRVTTVIADGLHAMGDPRLVSVALENLLGNAWKFTSKREDARIELGVMTLDDGKRVFFVRDNGAGFDMEYSHKLFGVFERLHTAVEFPGTGIGLATVQRVVSRHGGRVWAEGTVGKGATFYFSLAEPESTS